MTETTFADVLTYVAQSATPDEVKALFTAGNARVKAVRAADSAVVAGLLTPGARVELAGIRPAFLNGLKGSFVKLDDGRGKQRATIKLDDESLRYARQYAHNGQIGGIPVSSLRIL